MLWGEDCHSEQERIPSRIIGRCAVCVVIALNVIELTESGVCLVVPGTGIHAMRWTLGEAKDCMRQALVILPAIGHMKLTAISSCPSRPRGQDWHDKAP